MGLDLTDRKRPKKQLKQMNDSELSSATNDAIFELDFISGKSWHNKVSHDNLNCMTKICQLRKINYYGDLSCILMIVIELLKVLKNVMLGPQNSGQNFRFLRSDGTYGNFTNVLKL
jgi:hypothetical protein